MKTGLLVLLVVVAVAYGQPCEIVRYEYNNGKMVNYYKIEPFKCNDEPIYKMLHNSFYIYKSINGYWCDTHLANNSVSCEQPCEEIRFKLTSRTFENPTKDLGMRIVPEEFDSRFRTWELKSGESISCGDFEKEKLESIFGGQRTAAVVVTTTAAPTTTTMKFRLDVAQKMKDALAEKRRQRVLQGRNGGHNFGGFRQGLASGRMTIPEHQQQRSQQNFPSEDPNLVVAGQRQNSGSNVLPDGHRTGNIVENKVLINMTENAVKQINNALATTKEPGIQFQIQKDEAPAIVVKQVLTTQVVNSCPAIEFQLFDSTRLAFKLSLPLLQGVTCKSFPVFKSTNNVYIYRNIFGDWCHERLNQFMADIRCNHACNQKRMLPSGIASPTEATSVEIFNSPFKSIVTNHRYVCPGLFNCKIGTGCLNNGTCLEIAKNGMTEYKCQCSVDFSGRACDIVVNKCHSNPCLNNGTCFSKPYEEPKCVCPPAYTGRFCTTIQNPCLISNPCSNGGVCIHNSMNLFLYNCECPTGFEGRTCEREALGTCNGQPEGKLFPHPSLKTSFILCLRDGNYQLQVCPGELVYNTHLQRCDYNGDEPDFNDACKHNPCKNNAKCTNEVDGFSCTCTAGYTGQVCDVNIDDCEAAKCGENAKCVDLVNGYVCLCPNKYYGSDCDTNKMPIPCVDGLFVNVSRHSYPYDLSVIVECNERGNLLLKKCASSLIWDYVTGNCIFKPIVPRKQAPECVNHRCLNGGRCLVDRERQPFCFCEDGFVGDYCEVNVDDCASSPCMNNGTCVDGLRRYHCICTDRYIDKTCQDLDAPNPCKTVKQDALNKTDSTVRHQHPYTKEKYLVCNVDGYAQVLPCPSGLFWKEDEQTCAEIDSQASFELYTDLCKDKPVGTRLSYEYSTLKFVQCNEKGFFSIQDCSIDKPYFCETKSQCVSKYDETCKI